MIRVLILMFFSVVFLFTSCKKKTTPEYKTEIVMMDTEVHYKMVNDAKITTPISSYYAYIIIFSADWSSGNTIYNDEFIYKNRCVVGEEYSTIVNIPKLVENENSESAKEYPKWFYSYILFSTDSLLDVTHNNQFLAINNPNSYDLMLDNTIIKPGVKNTIYGRFTK